jgi:hypothetical protein
MVLMQVAFANLCVLCGFHFYRKGRQEQAKAPKENTIPCVKMQHYPNYQ